jgi:hypothetical protein
MDLDLFSCRNCIHNPSQGLTLGTGSGYCMKWHSLIERPERTTCKLLHRKDLAYFQTEESLREHAEEFASCTSMADLESHAPLVRHPPAESHGAQLDPMTRVVITYDTLDKPSLQPGLLNLLAGSTEGRRSLAYASLVRGAIHPGPMPEQAWDWVSGLVDDVDRIVFLEPSEVLGAGQAGDEAIEAARWEVLYTRLSGVQEVGWHASIDDLMFPMRELHTYVAEQDWNGLIGRLSELKERWMAQLKLRSGVGMRREPSMLLGPQKVLTDRAVSIGQSGPVREVLH